MMEAIEKTKKDLSETMKIKIASCEVNVESPFFKNKYGKSVILQE